MKYCILPILALAALLSGCGGGGGGGNAGPVSETVPAYTVPASGVVIPSLSVNLRSDATMHYVQDHTYIEPIGSIVGFLRGQAVPQTFGLTNDAKNMLNTNPPVIGYDAYVVTEIGSTNKAVDLYLVDKAGSALALQPASSPKELGAKVANGMVTITIPGQAAFQSPLDVASLVTALGASLPRYSALSAQAQAERVDAESRFLVAILGS